MTDIEKDKSSPPPLSRLEVFGFGAGEVALSLSWNAVGAFALYFYTNIAFLPAAIIGTILFVTRIFDAILDVVIGLVVDRTNTRWGKARPYLLFGAIPFGLLSVFVFISPDASETVRLIWAGATYFLLGLVLSGISIPTHAMLPMMARNLEDKLKLSASRSVGTSIGVIAVTASFLPAVKLFGSGDERQGFLIMATIIGVLATSFLFLMFATCRERFTIKSDLSQKVGKSLKSMVRNLAWLVVSGFAFLNFIRFGAILALTPYFAINVLEKPWMISILMPALSGTLLVSAFFAPAILKRLEMRNGCSWSIACAGVLYLLLPLVEESPWTFIGIYVASSMFVSVTLTGTFAMASDAVDFHQWRFGARQEGMLSAGLAFSVKAGMAFGAAIIAYALAFSDYDPTNVSEGSKQVISLLYYGIPPLIFAIQFVCLRLYPIDEKVRKEMTQNGSSST